MPAYNFQKRFAEMVRKRIKRQTIRAERKDGRIPEPGERFVGYTGMRTKQCRKLVDSVITEVLPVAITPDGIWLAGLPLDAATANAIAMLDGFANASEMLLWFRDQHGQHFSGHMIRWL